MIYAVSVFSPRITQIKRIKIGVIRGEIFHTINNPKNHFNLWQENKTDSSKYHKKERFTN